MSLTSHLNNRNSPVRQFIEQAFPNHRSVQNACRQEIIRANTLRPSASIPYGTIGTALDYRIRYYFDVTPFQHLVAFWGAVEASSNSFMGLFDDCRYLLGTP